MELKFKKIFHLFSIPASFLKDQVSPSTVDGDQKWGKEWVCPSGGLGHPTALTPSTHTHQGQREGSSWRKQTCGTQGKKILAYSDYSHLQDWGRLPVYIETQYVSVGMASRLNWVPGQAVGSAAGGVRCCDYWCSHLQASPHAVEPRGERAVPQSQAKHQVCMLSAIIHTAHMSILHEK